MGVRSLPTRAIRAGRRRRRARGFTLVELLVALTAGLLVSAAAYLLARNTMKSFQEESRMASGQVGAALGIARLTADLQRAGYMSSPDVANDPRVCVDVDRASVPLMALQVANEGSGASGGISATDMGYGVENPGLTVPDVVVISGNMTTAEQFEFRVVNSGTVHMAVDRAPIQRAFQDAGGDSEALEDMFRPRAADGTEGSRFARIVDATGKDSYVRVTDANATVSGGVLESMTLTIVDAEGNTPSNASAACGFVNRGAGLINPVSVIRYRVAQLCVPGTCSTTDTPYAPALRATGDDRVTGESTRAELIREEILPESVAAGDVFELGLTVPDSLAADTEGVAAREVVAEFTVQLDLGLVAVTNAPPVDAPALDLVTGADVDAVLPQRVRSVRVQLGTRARVPDREEGSPITGDNTVPSCTPDCGVTRYLIPVLATAGFRSPWVRMRTLQAEVQLPNLQGVQW